MSRRVYFGVCVAVGVWVFACGGPDKKTVMNGSAGEGADAAAGGADAVAGGAGDPDGDGGMPGSGTAGNSAAGAGAGGEAIGVAGAGGGSSTPALVEHYRSSEPAGIKSNIAIAADPSGRTVVTFRNAPSGQPSTLHAVVLDENGTPTESSPFPIVELGSPPSDADVAWIGDSGEFIVVYAAVIGSEQRIVGTIYDAKGEEVTAATPIDGNGFPDGNYYRYPKVRSNSAGTLFLTAQDTVNGVEEYLSFGRELDVGPFFVDSFPGLAIGGSLLAVAPEEPDGGLLWATGPTAINVGLFGTDDGAPSDNSPFAVNLMGASYGTPEPIEFPWHVGDPVIVTIRGPEEHLIVTFDPTDGSDYQSAPYVPAINVADTGYIRGFTVVRGGCDIIGQHGRDVNGQPVGDLFVTVDPDCLGEEPGRTHIITSEPDSLDWPNVMVYVFDVADFRAARSSRRIDSMLIAGVGYDESDQPVELAILELERLNGSGN